MLAGVPPKLLRAQSGGYEVLWSHTGGKHDVWKVDTSGNFESSIKANLWEDELKFGVDINLDGIDSGKKNNIYGSDWKRYFRWWSWR